MKKIIGVISLAVLMICVVSCYKKEYYYVESLDMVISLDRIHCCENECTYRVYLSKGPSISDSNYIEITRRPCSVPGPLLHFPVSKLGRTDTVYIEDRYHDVTGHKSKDFTFIVSTFEETRDSAGQRWGWTDTTMFNIPDITVEINEYFSSITVFDEEGYPSNGRRLKL